MNKSLCKVIYYKYQLQYNIDTINLEDKCRQVYLKDRNQLLYKRIVIKINIEIERALGARLQ